MAACIKAIGGEHLELFILEAIYTPEMLIGNKKTI